MAAKEDGGQHGAVCASEPREASTLDDEGLALPQRLHADVHRAQVAEVYALGGLKEGTVELDSDFRLLEGLVADREGLQLDGVAQRGQRRLGEATVAHGELADLVG